MSMEHIKWEYGSEKSTNNITDFRLTEPIKHLNVHEQVKIITSDALPKAFRWSSNASKDSRAGRWPYILQQPLKPKKFKRKKLYEKNFQTEPNEIHVKKESKTAKKQTLLWKPPKENLSAEKLTSASSLQSSSSSKSIINMDILCKEIESNSKFEKNQPKYVLNKSFTSLPNWIERHRPKEIKSNTIIQAGKPWHKDSECTWAVVQRNIASDPYPFTAIQKNSPKIDWGLSIFLIQKRKFDFEHRKIRPKRKIIKSKRFLNVKQFIDKEKSCKAHFLLYTWKKKNLESIPITADEHSTRTLSPFGSSSDITSPPVIPSHQLNKLSYTKKDDQKKKYSRPNINGIEKPWECLTERKWSSNIAKTTFFTSLVKQKPESPRIDHSKYPVYGQWPYVENMVKTMNTKSGTFKIARDFSYDKSRSYTSKKSSNILAFGSRKNILKKTTTSVISPLPYIKPVRKLTDDFLNFKQLLNPITEIEKEAQSIPSILNEQKFFPGYIESQAASIKPILNNPAFSYQLSNLHLYESNNTYLKQKNTYFRTLIYYSTFNNEVSYDSFKIITTKRYLNKMPYLDVPSSGVATIYYPSGKIAIQCTYSTIENKPELYTRRYTIRNELTQRVEAVFDSLGNGIIYDKKGNIIFNYSQNFGVHIANNRLYKWRWHNIPVNNEKYKEEMESRIKPPNIPENEIEEMLLRNVNLYNDQSLYLQSSKSIDRGSSERSEDSNPSVLSEKNPLANKSDGKINYGVVTQFKPFIVKINEYMKLHIKDQKHMQLKFQANEVKLTIQVGILLYPKIILRHECIDFHSMPHEKIVCKFDKIVGETESLLKILKCVGDGKKLKSMKYKTKLIDFNDKDTNLLENENFMVSSHNFNGKSSHKLKSSNAVDNQVQPMSDHTIRVKAQDIKSTHKRYSIQRNETIIKHMNKIQDEDYAVVECEEEKITEISQFFQLNNLLEGSNPIASNVSVLIKDRVKLKQFLHSSKQRK